MRYVYLDDHLAGLLLDIINVSNHVESTFWKIVVFSSDNRLESTDSVDETDELSGGTGENLSNVEWLRHELLDLTCTSDGELIVFRRAR